MPAEDNTSVSPSPTAEKPSDAEAAALADPKNGETEKSRDEMTRAEKAAQTRALHREEAQTEAAKEQARKDAEAAAEHPNEPVVRAANPEVGGEDFGYGPEPTKAEAADEGAGESFDYAQ